MKSLAIAWTIAVLAIPPMAMAQTQGSNPSAQPDLAGSGPAYRHWSRGQVLPPEARTAPIADYDQFHLRHPPHGYDWYRCGDQFVLASTESGMIFEVIDGD